MGCVLSRIEKEERVTISKERKMLMKQLVGFRREFADSQLCYLRSLKNTGVTLRQFTESESLELENIRFGPPLPPSPPPPLPPSPPPPPNFSPDLRKDKGKQKVEVAQEDIIEIDEDNSCTPPPPPLPSSTWDFWDPFAPSSPHCEKKSEIEEENWAETKSEFDEEEQEGIVGNNAVNMLPEKPLNVELLDDNSSMVSWHTKDTASADMAMVVWRRKKTLAGIVKELDDYFLKASDGGKDIVILMDINSSDTFLRQSSKATSGRYSSGKVFNAFSWGWSSKSHQCTRSAPDFCGPSEPCRPGAHSVTLDKLYAEDQRLYKDIKDEESTKLEHERKSLLLQKLEDEDRDSTKIEKTRSSVEILQSNIVCLKESNSRSCSTISKLIDEELHPQLIAVTSGLMSMWRTMYECHQVQNHISQQLSHLMNQQSMDPTTNYHRQAASQLKTEVTAWYNSFHRLVKSQGEYVRALCRWIKLTYCFVEDSQRSVSASAVHTLCEEWQLALDRLPDKVASEAIKSFLSAIQSIVLQQEEELTLRKKTDKLEKKLQRELNSLSEMEMKLAGNLNIDDANSPLTPKHPLTLKRAKIEALKKRVNEEKAKYMNSTRVTRAMTLSNLRTSLPHVFQALMGFSSAYAQSLEAILSRPEPVDCDAEFSPIR